MTEPFETNPTESLEEFASQQAEGDRETHGRENSGLESNGAGNGSSSNPSISGDSTVEAIADGETESSGFLPVLTNLNFLALWSGQIFSQLADKVYLVLMIALISSRFQAEGQSISGWVSAIMIAFTIPAILFGSVAGVLVGRVAKKQVLVITNVLRGVLVLALPFLLGWVGTATAWGDDLPLGFYLLLLITFSVSTLTQFFAPAEQSILPLVVEDKDLLPANSLYTTTMMAATIIGFAIGDKVLNWAEELLSALFAMDSGKAIAVGVSYVIAAGLLLLMRVHEPPDFQAQQGKVWQDIKEGFAYLQEKREVRSALIELVVLFSVFAALAVLAVRIAEVIPTLQTDQFGGLLSSGSIGLGVGALCVGQFGPKLGRKALGIVGSIGMVASLAGLSVSTHELSLAIASIISFGFFAALVGIPAQTTIQEKTPPAMRGKVFGLQNNAVNIALSLPLALAGIAEQRIGLQATLLGLALFVALGNLSTWYLSRPAQTTDKA